MEFKNAVLPKDKSEWLGLRALDVTSTEVSALFGCSPYMTEFELWHVKKDQLISTVAENERMKWGVRLQDSIAAGIAEENGWKIRRMDEYIRDPATRAGSSFDFLVYEGETKTPKALLEIKNVDSLAFRDGWLKNDDGTIEAPPHIELQVQHQMMVSGLREAYIGALVGGNQLNLIYRPVNDEVVAALRAKIRMFWTSIEQNMKPDPNFSRDSEFLIKLNQYSDPGKQIDVSESEEIQQMAEQYKTYGDSIKLYDELRTELKAKMLMKIGTAEKAVGSNFTISAGLVGPAKYEVNREGYRTFKITWRKNT